MVISWGKCTIEWAYSVNGAPSGAWTAIDTPKEDSTQLNATAGDKTEAKEEGGGVVDTRYGKPSWELVFDLFAKKNGQKPWVDSDGMIEGDLALRVIPEDGDCIGIRIDRCNIHCEDSYTTADGILWHYVASCVKPASGNTIKYTNTGAGATLNISATSVSIQAAASSTGTVTITGATSTNIQTEITFIDTGTTSPWLTAATAQSSADVTVTFTATANTARTERSARVKITDTSTGASATVIVTQAAAAS